MSTAVYGTPCGQPAALCRYRRVRAIKGDAAVQSYLLLTYTFLARTRCCVASPAPLAADKHAVSVAPPFEAARRPRLVVQKARISTRPAWEGVPRTLPNAADAAFQGGPR